MFHQLETLEKIPTMHAKDLENNQNRLFVEVPAGMDTAEVLEVFSRIGMTDQKAGKGNRKRNADPVENEKPEANEKPAMKETAQDEKSGTDEKSARDGKLVPVFTQEAGKAYDFLRRAGEGRFVYHCGSWWSFDEKNGWKAVSDRDMNFQIAVHLRTVKDKCTEKTAQDILFSANSFCNLHTSEATFEQTYFIEQDLEKGEIRAEHRPGWIVCEDKALDVKKTAKALFLGEGIPEDAVIPRTSKVFTQGLVPCSFDPDAKCPEWENFVAQACPQDWPTLQEMFGLSLTCDRSFNAFFVIHGPSGTGKSTCLNILQKLNEGTVSQVSLGRFGERFFIWPLTQNRVNIVHDMDSIYEGDGSVSLREAVLKSAASGESIEVERKHRQAQREYLRALCVFGTNQLPRFADKSNAICQRMRIIEFPNPFRDTEKQIRNLTGILETELSGILVWALKGYGELLCSGRNAVWESESSGNAKIDAIKDSRPEILFCDEMLEKNDFPKWIPSLNIYKAYEKYCLERGYKPAGMSKAVTAIVEYMQAEKKRVTFSGKTFMGIRGLKLIGEEEF